MQKAAITFTTTLYKSCIMEHELSIYLGRFKSLYLHNIKCLHQIFYYICFSPLHIEFLKCPPFNFVSNSKVNREGNVTPLQYSCLENPMDGGAW